MLEKDRSNMIVSVFRRLGGEGEFTKIITEDNKPRYANILASVQLKELEKGLIIYYKDEDDWCLITNKRLIVKPAPNDIQYEAQNVEDKSMLNRGFIAKPASDNVQYEVLLTDLARVEPAYQLKYDKRYSFTDISLLHLINKSAKSYVVKLEEGSPFHGIIQTLIRLFT